MRHTLIALAAVAALCFIGAAAAGQVYRESIHDERTFVLENFCDVEGLDVQIARTLDLSVHVVPHGRDRLAYFLGIGRVVEVLRNTGGRGQTLTSVANVTEKDQRVTINADGTLTILVLATGNAVLYGADGKAIARNPGQLRYELLIDEKGTPDPQDDEVTFVGIVKGSTGRSDDFCEAAVPRLS